MLNKSDVLVRHIQDHCITQGWTLSLAESCTGGRLAACLTQLPGCSHYFLGSIVAYSNHLKKSVLGVDAQLLVDYGAVSGPVVSQMAQGVLQLTGSQYSLAVSGIAGPEGGTPAKPIGTLWAAIASQDEKVLVWNFHLTGNRQEIMEMCVDVLLSQLWLLIKTKKRNIK